MEQIRTKVVLVMLAVFVFLGIASVANAQVAFQMSSLVRDVRREGTAEAVGQVTLAATTAGTIKATSTISLNYGTAIEAGTGTVTCTAVACVSPANFTVAVSGSSLTVTFVTDVLFAIGQSMTISGVRVNANTAAGSTINAAGAATVPAASASTNPITFFIVSTVQVATIQSPATTVVVTAAAANLLTCVAGGPNAFTVKTTENFNQAFLSKTDEDGLGGTGAGANSVNLTIRIVFASVPVGVTVTFTSSAASSGTLTITNPVTAAQTSATGATTLTYDFVITATSSTGANEQLTAAFTASNAAALTPVGPPVAVAAAVSLVGGSSTTVPKQVPRFATNTQGTGTAFTVADCTTNLMFPFASNFGGFDTGITIANTTSDDNPFTPGLPAQDGSCTLVLYPTNRATTTAGTVAPASAVSVPSGATLVTSMSAISAFSGKEGYILAQCGFLGAHGFAFLFVTPATAVASPSFTGLSQGYLALVVANPRVVAAGGEGLNE